VDSCVVFFFFSSRRRHTRFSRDWSSDVCSSDLTGRDRSSAAVASTLVRSVEFKSLLFREERSTRQKIYLVLWIGAPLALGVWIRFSQRSFLAGDLSFETTLLLGMLGGRFCGMVGGSLLALPAVLHGELATPPFL